MYHIDHRGMGTFGEFAGSVGRHIAGAVKVVGYVQAARSLVVEDVDGDSAINVAVLVRASEGVFHGAAVEVEGDAAVDVGSHRSHIALLSLSAHLLHTLRATVDIANVATFDGEYDIAVDDIGQVTAAVDLVEVSGAAFHGKTQVALCIGHVATSEEGADGFGIGFTGTALVDSDVFVSGDATGGVAGTEDGGV